MCAGIGVGVLTAVMGSVFLAALVGAAVVVVRRSLGGAAAGGAAEARAVLDHRLATGEISVEDYLERESLLRAPVAPRERARVSVP
jgi:uncharacterized membrane protein